MLLDTKKRTQKVPRFTQINSRLNQTSYVEIGQLLIFGNRQKVEKMLLVAHLAEKATSQFKFSAQASAPRLFFTHFLFMGSRADIMGGCNKHSKISGISRWKIKTTLIFSLILLDVLCQNVWTVPSPSILIILSTKYVRRLKKEAQMCYIITH